MMSLKALLKQARIYLGSHGAYVRSRQRLYARLLRNCESFAKKRGMDYGDVFNQVMDRAAELGPILARPGKDY